VRYVDDVSCHWCAAEAARKELLVIWLPVKTCKKEAARRNATSERL